MPLADKVIAILARMLLAILSVALVLTAVVVEERVFARGREPRRPDPASGRVLMATRETTVAPLDDLDHVRGASGGRVIVEYGDYECPYSR